MKKILCLIDNLGSGGAQRQMVNLAVLLQEHGYSIEFVVYSQNRFFQYILDEAEIPVIYIEAESYFKRIVRVRNYLLRTAADVVITFLETPGFLACLAKSNRVKWKLITSERSAKESTFVGIRQKIFNYFERYADIKVCNSQNAMQMWKEHYPQYADKLRAIYNPVIIPALAESKELSDGRLRIVIAASYQRLKNPLGVIAAIGLLGEEDRARLSINWYGKYEVTTGNTEIYDEAVKQIKENGLQDTIVLHGETQEIYSIMRSSDVIGLFSTVEGLPNAICEGMMLGKPIIMTRISDYDVLTDGNGILCDSDPESIASAFRRLLALSHDELEEMGKISAEKAKKLFGKESIMKQWMEVIEK